VLSEVFWLLLNWDSMKKEVTEAASVGFFGGGCGLNLAKIEVKG